MESNIEKSEAPRRQPPPPPPSGRGLDVVLRVLLFAATLAAVILMVTSKQTERVTVPGIPYPFPRAAKFNYSPAFIYFVAALSVACLYSIISTLASLLVIGNPANATKFFLHFIICDVLMLGIVATATGAAAGVAYIGLKGNSHSGWTKVCNVYDTYCRHIGSSIALALFASGLLVFLTLVSVVSLHRRIPPPAY